MKRELISVLKEKEISEKEFNRMFTALEIDLLKSGVAFETIEKIRGNLKEKIVTKRVERRKVHDEIERVIKEELFTILDVPKINLNREINESKQRGTPYLILFLGFNGVGKSLTVAKVANYLRTRGYKVLIAAADTFRAAGAEQMVKYAEKIGVSVVRQMRGADSAAVIYNAREKAKARKYDVICADTAGRTHTDENLLEELRKIVRVNKPNLKVLIIDGLIGNDAVPQCIFFNESIGVDCVIITKMDATDKGGVLLTVADVLRKPILFLGTGQKYGDLAAYEPRKILKMIL